MDLASCWRTSVAFPENFFIYLDVGPFVLAEPRFAMISVFAREQAQKDVRHIGRVCKSCYINGWYMYLYDGSSFMQSK